MIASFANKASEDIFDAKCSKKACKFCPAEIWKIATRKRDQLNKAEYLEDLRIPPAIVLRSVRMIDPVSTGSESTTNTFYASRGPIKVPQKLRSPTITNITRLPYNRPATHPGEMLLEEFLNPHGMT